MHRERPSVVALAGPNGAGKSTMAGQLLVDVLGVSEFVDADVLARALPRSEAAAVAAGRAMLKRFDELQRDGRLSGSKRLSRAGRSHREFAGWSGPDTSVTWYSSGCRTPTLQWPGWPIACVWAATPYPRRVRRRYRSGLRNFFDLYQPLTITWRMYDNSTHEPRLIASGAGAETLIVNDAALWQRIRVEAGHEA